MNGAPVCARNFHFTPCDILSSIKIQDSLMNKESYFYAELVRLKEIIDHVRITPKTLVILDEILRGTNSKDKHEGSLGLLEKLISLNATVIIATHDLGIGELERKYPNVVSNNCFEVELENDQVLFDYKLKKGLSQKLNASFLMKKMEIIN
jgi:DNA mismatch repair ATPase MutS